MVLELRTHMTPLSRSSLVNNCKSAGKDSMAKGSRLYRYHFFSIAGGDLVSLSTRPASCNGSRKETSRLRDCRPPWLPTRLFGNTSVRAYVPSIEIDHRRRADRIADQNFCAFKIRTPNNQKQTNFCRNEYNVTGLCNRQSCPLANSRYASVRPHPDKPNVLYLYMKTVERAHMPNRLWEKIRLPANPQEALAMVDEKLMYGSSNLSFFQSRSLLVY